MRQAPKIARFCLQLPESLVDGLLEYSRGRVKQVGPRLPKGTGSREGCRKVGPRLPKGTDSREGCGKVGGKVELQQLLVGRFRYRQDAQSLSIEAKFCKRARLGATYFQPRLYHCRLEDVCTVCNYILARAKGVGADFVSYAQP